MAHEIFRGTTYGQDVVAILSGVPELGETALVEGLRTKLGKEPVIGRFNSDVQRLQRRKIIEESDWCGERVYNLTPYAKLRLEITPGEIKEEADELLKGARGGESRVSCAINSVADLVREFQAMEAAYRKRPFVGLEYRITWADGRKKKIR